MVIFKTQCAPLPSDFRGTPQQLLEAIVSRLEISSDQSTFIISDTMPTGNQGPWLKNGTQLWVYDAATLTYVPLNVDYATLAQIFVGADAPIPSVQKLWLKVTGTTVAGLFYWTGETGGWVAQSFAIAPLSITTIKLATNSVSTAKVRDLSVTPALLARDLAVAKLALGPANSYLRMNATATAPEWGTPNVVTSDLSILTNAVTEYVHGFGATPHFVTAAMVCQSDVGGWFAGQEVPLGLFSTNLVGASFATVPMVVRSATRVYLRFAPKIFVRNLFDTINVVPTSAAQWKLRFYLTP